MKEFDLELALAGEPVKLRDGTKAYVKFTMPDDYDGEYPLIGFFKYRDEYVQSSWTRRGWFSSVVDDGDSDIIGMWEEPRPRVQLDLPCPLKEPQEGMHYILRGEAHSCCYTKDVHDAWMTANGNDFESGLYFASREDAQEWLQAMRNSRK